MSDSVAARDGRLKAGQRILEVTDRHHYSLMSLS